MAAWSPITFSIREPDQIVLTEAGLPTIEKGTEYVQRAWRCELHDDPSRPWS